MVWGWLGDKELWWASLRVMPTTIWTTKGNVKEKRTNETEISHSNYSLDCEPYC